LGFGVKGGGGVKEWLQERGLRGRARVVRKKDERY